MLLVYGYEQMPTKYLPCTKTYKSFLTKQHFIYEAVYGFCLKLHLITAFVNVTH